MPIAMAGLDFTQADVQKRETYSADGPDRLRVLQTLRAFPGVDGCVFLSTCNRSELYISHHHPTPPDCARMLAMAFAADPEEAVALFSHRAGMNAHLHLMRVASGMEAAVPGDDQIITQVRAALEEAREAGVVDPELETLFRSAVTAGKKVKSAVMLGRAGASVAGEAVRRLETALDGLEGKHALVIGSGVIGRLAATTLREGGATVSITMREGKPNRTPPPEGCTTVPFEDRHRLAGMHDIVVSATRSPHFTLEAEPFRNLAATARGSEKMWLVDLAVPRDIDPEIGTLPGVTLWNVDDFQDKNPFAIKEEHLRKATEILDRESRRFELWRQNRARYQERPQGLPNFPIFINVDGVRILVAGGGKIAVRRAGALLRFGARVRLVAPEICPDMERLIAASGGNHGQQDADGVHGDGGGIEWTARTYRPEDLDGVTLAIAATDDRDTNRRIGMEAKARGIFASVADRQEECSFFFPALIDGDVLTAGLISKNGDHALVKTAAVEIRKELDKIEQHIAGGQPGEHAGGAAGHPGYGRDTA